MSASRDRIRRARAVEAAMKAVTGACAAAVMLSAVGLLGYLLVRGLPAIDWRFLTNMPLNDVPGIWPAIVGTFWLTVGTAAFALPVGIAAGIYLSEYARRGAVTRVIRLSIANMAGVPSIVYGLWGFFLIMPYAAELALWLHRNLGWIPIFDVRGSDADAAVWDTTRYVASAFCAGIAVSMMVMPMAFPVLPQVLSQTPPGEKEAALALGATRWGMITSVVLPFGRGGIIGGTMLGLGRALGETIAVVLIISPAFEIKPNILEIGTSTVSALIAGRFGEASAAQLSALLAAGVVLFLITLVINTLAAVIVNRSRSGAGTDA